MRTDIGGPDHSTWGEDVFCDANTGKILTATTVTGISRVYLTRYLPNGELDPQFGIDGVYNTYIGHENITASQLLMDTLGRMLALWTVDIGSFDCVDCHYVGMIRYLNDYNIAVAQTQRPDWAAQVLPNPAVEQARFVFSTSNGGAVRVALFDATGQRIRELMRAEGIPEGVHETTLDLTGIPPGLYLLTVQCGNDRSSTPFVKQ